MKANKLISVILCIAMVLSTMSLVAFAEGTDSIVNSTSENSTHVAKIGDNQYTTLLDAVNIVESGDTITLISDIEITEATEFAMKNGVTLDLNGKTIKGDDGKAVFVGTNFTIKNGTVTGFNGKDYYPITTDSESKKALRTASNIVIEGLTFANSGIKIRGGATVTLKDNEITANQSLFKYAVWAYGSANVTIESGTYFGGKNGYDVFAEGNAKLALYGGTYKVKNNKTYMAKIDDLEYVKNADGTYTVMTPVSEADAVAKIGDTNYATLLNAVKAVKADDEIVLVKDCTIDMDGATVELPDGVTLDLGEKTLTVPFQKTLFAGEDISIKNGTITTGSTENYGLYIMGGSFTVENVITTNGINVQAGKVILNDVDATCPNKYYAVYAGADANVTINSGNYKTVRNAKNLYADGKITVYGGTFSKDPSDFVAEGYEATKNGDVYIVDVAVDGIAEVNDKEYKSLQEAIDAANANDTVTLLADIEAAEQIVINNSLKLELGEYTISGNSEDAVLRIYSDVADTTIDVTINATTGGIINNGSGYAIYAGEDLNGGEDKERTNLTIYGGNYETAGTDAIRQIMGLCTINGGSYKSSFGRTVLNGVRWYGAEFAINGGKFYGFNPACVSVWTGFDGKNYDNFYHQHDIIADGKTATYADGWYTVVDGDYTEKVSTKSLCYPSLEAALWASNNMNDAANLGVITLLADDTIDLGGETITLLDDVTIDLGGNTLTVPFQKTLFAGDNITIKNGTITTGSTENYGLYIMSGSFTVEDVVCTNGINVQAGEVILNDVDATCPNKYYAVYAGAEADVTINSGNYSTVRNAKNLYAAGTITVYGGTFNKMPDAEYLAEDRHVVKSGSAYTVYEGFLNALSAAEADDTVYLMSDIEIEDTIIIDKSITLDLGANTITSTAAKNVLYSTADLTINATEGGIYSETAYVAVGQDNGVCTINGGSFKASGETGDYANGKPVYNTLVLNNSDFYEGVTGSFVINGGKFYGFNPGCMSVNKHDHHDHDSIAEGKIATLDTDGWFTVTEGEFAYKVVCDCKAPASSHQHCFATEAEAEQFVEMMGNCKFDKIVEIVD